MDKTKIAVVAISVAAFLWLSGSTLYAKKEFSKKEGQKCVFCHVKAGKKDLNDVGKCYKEKKSLASCNP